MTYDQKIEFFKQPTVVVYHSGDFDGVGSAALLYNFLKDNFTQNSVEFIGLDYKDSFDINWFKGKNVLMVDFSIQPFEKFIEAIKLSNKFIHIDHHQSIIDKVDRYDMPDNFYNYYNLLAKDSAIAITYRWLYGDGNKLPKVVEYLSLYDTWNHEDNPEILALQLGLKTEIGLSFSDYRWWGLFNNPNSVERYIEVGTIIQQYVQKQDRSRMKELSFELEFEGLKFIAINTTNLGSLQFKEHPDYERYENFMVFYWYNNQWSVHMYSTNTTGKVLEIAKKYEGGGHLAACGFQTKSLSFIK